MMRKLLFSIQHNLLLIKAFQTIHKGLSKMFANNNSKNFGCFPLFYTSFLD